MNKSALYSNAVVKMTESGLLSAEGVKRMLSAADIAACVLVLRDFGYNESIIADSPDDIDALLNAELEKTLAFFKEMCVDESLFKAVMRRYDYHNVKTLLKEFCGGADTAHALYPFGGFALSELKLALKSGDYGGLPSVMAAAALKVKELSGAGGLSGKVIDIILDAAMYDETSALYKKINSAVIRRYFTAEADLKNICTAARMKMHRFERKALTAQLVRGGKIGFDMLYELFESPPQGLPGIFSGTEYDGLIKELAADLSENRPLPRFEYLCEEFLFGLSREGKDDFFDNGPLFSWYIQKLAEMKTVKLIYVSKKSGIAAERIRPLLKPIYK